MPRGFRVYYPSASPEILSVLRDGLDPGVELDPGEEIPDPASYRVLIEGRPTREQLSASPVLEALLIPWAGLPAPTVETLRDFPELAVHNLHHNAIPTAELALALLFAAAKEVVPLDRALRCGDWTPRHDSAAGTLLHGKRITILGYGAIGRRVARVCEALGMDVQAIRRRPDERASVHGPGELGELLPETRFLVICLPLTVETEGLIGAEELALLPPDAVLVNIGRGPIVGEEALFRALSEGRLAAAGLDVWYEYPKDEKSRTSTPPSRFPFHELSNVVMSPHRGGHTEAMATLRGAHLAESLNRWLHEGVLPHRVDLEAGY